MQPLFVGLLTAVITALGGYLVVARRLSGSIKTTEAEDLWEESRSLRKDYHDQIITLRHEIVSLREELLEVQKENARLKALCQELEKTVNGGK